MTPNSNAARDYSRANGEKFVQELFEMLRIPSLSGDPAHAGDIRRMADWLAEVKRPINCAANDTEVALGRAPRCSETSRPAFRI